MKELRAIFCVLGVAVTVTPIVLATTGRKVFRPINNFAEELKPGHGSDHQDFGMARFGVTFSY